MWGKFLARDIVIPVGGWTWAWKEGLTDRSATIPAGTYDTALHVAAALDDACSGVAATTVTVSQVGKTTVNTLGMTEMRWASTTDGLAALLGFDQDELVVGGEVSSSHGHTHGWYPGALSHDYSLYRGAGLARGALWIPVDVAIRQYAGNDDARIVTPGQLRPRRALRFDLVTLAEARDLNRGVAQLLEQHLHRRFRWYLDRTVGAPGSYGTQGDPRADTDDDCDWWAITLEGQPRLVDVPGTSGWLAVEMVVSAGAYS